MVIDSTPNSTAPTPTGVRWAGRTKRPVATTGDENQIKATERRRLSRPCQSDALVVAPPATNELAGASEAGWGRLQPFKTKASGLGAGMKVPYYATTHTTQAVCSPNGYAMRESIKW